MHVHVQVHGRIAKLLRQFEIVNDLSEDAMVAECITVPFLPHGLGHPLGLQVHDVAGFMQDDRGNSLALPSRYFHLRCTRVLQIRMVLTIEPGLYYGGTHLGTGGLVKAYGCGGRQQALKQVSTVVRIPRRRFVLRCDYPQLAWIEAAVQQAEGLIVEGDYRESIILTLEILVHCIAMGNDKLRDLSRGALQLTSVSQ